MGTATALSSVLSKATARVESGRATKDPAGVSKDVQLLIPRTAAARRLQTASTAVTEALERDDDRQAVLSALSRMFFKYLDDPAPTGLANKVASLRRDLPVTTTALGLGGPDRMVRPTRAYGSQGIHE